jgi:hypothetical protein
MHYEARLTTSILHLMYDTGKRPDVNFMGMGDGKQCVLGVAMTIECD